MSATSAVGDIGASFYFAPATLDTGKRYGLGGLRFYVAGRGGLLGIVAADVAYSAFGFFEPDFFRMLWDSALERISAPRAARLFTECAHDHGRAHFATVIEASSQASLPRRRS